MALFKGMISYMDQKVFILGMALAASVWFIPVCAAAPDKVTFLQDENFFLQDEIRKLQAELIDRDNASKKVLLERETARQDLVAAIKEKEALEDKIGSLNKMLESCDAQAVRHAEEAVVPYRSQLKDAGEQLKVMALTLEEKNAHIARLAKENAALQEQARVFGAEKLSLLHSIKKVSADHEALKASFDAGLADARLEADDKVKAFQARLAAEQKLVEEKISAAKKPLESRIVDMEAACRAREAETVQQGHEAQALLREKTRKLEEQILLLRENAAFDVRQAQEEAAVKIKDLEDQLDTCRQGL